MCPTLNFLISLIFNDFITIFQKVGVADMSAVCSCQLCLPSEDNHLCELTLFFHTEFNNYIMLNLNGIT